MDNVIIGVIIVAALGLTIFKVFVRPSCNCGCGGKRHKKNKSLPEGGDANCPLAGGPPREN